MPRKIIIPGCIPKDGTLLLPRMLISQRKNWLISLTPEQRVTQTLQVEKEGKSWSQVKTIFGLILSTIKQHFDEHGWDNSVLFRLSEPTGIPVTIADLKTYLYAACPLYNEDHERIHLSDTQAYTDNVADWITRIMDYAATQWQCYIPNPRPDWKEHPDGQ